MVESLCPPFQTSALVRDTAGSPLSPENPPSLAAIPPRKRPRFTPINQQTQSERSVPSSMEWPGKPYSDLSTSNSKRPSDIDEHCTDITLLSTLLLPDRVRSLFPFQYFNGMQSKAFQPIYATDNNIVVSSPTGSGKTVCFEFAIARLMEADISVGSFKVAFFILALLK
jgi:superfamily II RNA helicase